MPVYFKCPNCRKRVSTSKSNIGKRGKCPRCGKKTVIPSPKNMSSVIEPDTVQHSEGSIQHPDGVAASVIHKSLDYAIAALGQHTLRRNIHNMNGANLVLNHSMDTGNKLGLSKEQMDKLVPFPQSPANTTVNVIANEKDQPLPEKPKESSNLLPWVVAIALGASGLCGGFALNQYLNKPVAPAPVDDSNPGVGLEVE